MVVFDTTNAPSISAPSVSSNSSSPPREATRPGRPAARARPRRQGGRVAHDHSVRDCRRGSAGSPGPGERWKGHLPRLDVPWRRSRWRGELQNSIDRLDPELLYVSVDGADYGFGRWGSAAEKAEADMTMALAWRNSRTPLPARRSWPCPPSSSLAAFRCRSRPAPPSCAASAHRYPAGERIHRRSEP